MPDLSTILAARKQQVAVAQTKHLVGLRNNNDQDSDDDDDDDDERGTGSALTSGGKGGGGDAAARSVELLLGRAENLLRSPKADERKKTIASLEDANLSASQLKPLLRPLLLRFSDDAERCRDGAVGLFRRWQSQCSDASEVSGALPFLIPVMVERLGSEKVAEPAEEVRAALVMLMRDVLLRCRALIRPYIAEVGSIALGCARDTHPEVIKGLCELMATVAADVLRPICRETTPKQVKPFSTKLIEALLPHITHRHGAVRLQVLGALEELLLCGAGTSVETLTGWRLKNNVPIAEFYGKGAPRVNYLADLSRDRQVTVRRKFVRVCARWCREMDGEDLYEQEVRVICYLVSGLTDDDEVTAQTAREEIERLGSEYLEKNMKDYKERIEYGYADEAAETRSMSLPPPKPFPCRPPLGARERVKGHFRALIHPICAELDTWTSVERLQSARLCEVLLAYCEGSVTEFAHQLLPALAKGIDHELKGLPEVVGRCAALVAQHTAPSEYMPLVVGKANSDALNPLTQRMQYLEMIPHLLRGVKPHQLPTAIRGLAPLFADRPLVCTQHTPLRNAVRAALEAALRCCASVDAAAAALSPQLTSLASMLLHATATHLASAPSLQPQVTSLSDGLEDVSDADESAWQGSARIATAMAQPLDRLPLCARTAAGAWGTWKREVLAAIERGEAEADDEYAPLARKLVETILSEAGASVGGGGPVVTDKLGDEGGSGGSKAASAGPRQVLAIDECDDFSDEEEEAEPKAEPKATEADVDEFNDDLD